MSEADETPKDRIEELEAQIDELQEALGGSRKLVLAGRVCIFAGVAMLLCQFVGLMTFAPLEMIVGIVIGLGGVVLMGSSVGSTRQIALSLQHRESERNAAIDALELIDRGNDIR